MSVNSSRQQVSFVVRHLVSPGAETDYEVWLKRIMNVAAGFPGHLGVQVVRPPSGGHEYVTVVRFASEADANRWSLSQERRDIVASVTHLLDGADNVQIVSGIDFWFTPHSLGQRQPVRWKQWLITTSVIWPLTLVVPEAYAPLFDRVPLLGYWGVSHGVVAATIVALVVYAIMPRYVRAVSGWLFR